MNRVLYYKRFLLVEKTSRQMNSMSLSGRLARILKEVSMEISGSQILRRNSALAGPSKESSKSTAVRSCLQSELATQKHSNSLLKMTNLSI